MSDRKIGPRYGLSCGYWTNRPGKIDKHIWAHLSVDPDDPIFDLCECHGDYRGEKLHQCKGGIE